MQKPSEVSSFSSQPTSNLADKADAYVDRLSGGAHQAIDHAAEAASSVAHRVGRKGDELLATQHRWLEVSQDTVCRHPFAAAAVVFAAGVVFARFIGRH